MKAEIRKQLDALLDEVRAVGYEEGFVVGQSRGREEGVASAMNTLSMGDAKNGVTPDFKAELHHMLDRITLFRHMIATHDTRHSMLGEIIRDFAALLGKEPSPETEINTVRVDHVVEGDEIEDITGEWQRISNISTIDGKLALRSPVGLHFFAHRETVRVRRRVGGA